MTSQDLVTKLWDEARPVIQEGLAVLNKTLILGLPASSMPPVSKEKDTGIGSPYGEGAARVWRFWHNIIHKIMIGPIGKTSAVTWHSPYLSSWDYNPFLIDLEKLVQRKWLSKKTLNKIWKQPKKDDYIDFHQVESDYLMALSEAHQKSKSLLSFDSFCNQLLREQMQRTSFLYVGDIPINIPPRVSTRHPDWFLKDWSLGAPPDQYSDTPQKWGFPVLNPKKLFSSDKTQPLGPAGRMFKKLMRFYLAGNRGGIRIDHFIGWVDPYCFYTGKKNYSNGRLYSSPKHPLLKAFYLKDKRLFQRMTQNFLMPFIDTFHLSPMDIFPEDLGIRPPQMDKVLKTFRLGRMLPVQFNEPEDGTHLYHLSRAEKEDIAVLDTHDNPPLLAFFEQLPFEKRRAFAQQLATDLRFHYTDDLTQPIWLYRMQWGAALASPAKRVMVFFPTLMGQEGRYNTPGTLDSWHLRCLSDFEAHYFNALKQGKAFNPFEAICLAIYAKGDAFYHQHEPLVHKLRTLEADFFNALQAL